MTDERLKSLKAGKAKLIEEAVEYGTVEAKRYCDTAAYDELAIIAELEADADGRYPFPEGEELDLEGFPARVHGAIETAFVAEVQVYLDQFDRMA